MAETRRKLAPSRYPTTRRRWMPAQIKGASFRPRRWPHQDTRSRRWPDQAEASPEPRLAR
jgi:hypothetical protein